MMTSVKKAEVILNKQFLHNQRVTLERIGTYDFRLVKEYEKFEPSVWEFKMKDIYPDGTIKWKDEYMEIYKDV
jgi:hypothetical protein